MKSVVSKRTAGGYSVAFLIPVAENCNRICNASVVQMRGLAIVYFSCSGISHLFIYFNRNAYIEKNNLLYGNRQKLGKNPLIS